MARTREAAYSEDTVKMIRTLRWRARTDLLFLCNKILPYTRVSREVHGPIIDILQKFPVPQSDAESEAHDYYDPRTNRWHYTPLKDLEEILCASRTLILDPRGWYKTTINTMAHTIQWIINYPDIAIAVIQSSGPKAILFLDEIKQHFKYTAAFRELFPEHVPQVGIENWGTKEQFTTEARTRSKIRREPTVMALALDKGGAGMHVDVMKVSDMVEPNNSLTRDQCIKVYKQFVAWQNVLVSPSYPIDVEGTRYDFSDAYGRIMENEEKRVKNGERPMWKIHVRSCYKRQFAEDEPEIFTPETLSRPYLLDANGKYISHFEKHSDGKTAFPTEDLERLRSEDPEVFACQQLNSPNDWAESIAFPLTALKLKTRAEFKAARIAYNITTIDTAETANNRSKYSAITTVGWDSFGRGWVHDIRHAKMLPEDLVNEIFASFRMHRPLQVVIEETSFVTGLMAAINRQIQLGAAPQIPFRFVRRENDVRKTERILNTLQPFYKRGEIYFLEDLPCLDHLKNELSRFPKYEYTDILDTLSDQFQARSWLGRNPTHSKDMAADPKELGKIQEMALKELTNTLTDRDLATAAFGGYRPQTVAPQSYFNPTGGL